MSVLCDIDKLNIFSEKCDNLIYEITKNKFTFFIDFGFNE